METLWETQKAPIMHISKVLTVLAVFAAGCGHTGMNGSVVMASSPTEAHVCLVEGSVAVGDHVTILRHTCVSNGRAGRVCTNEPAGAAEVTELLGTHYASVRALGEAEIHEGDTVRLD